MPEQSPLFDFDDLPTRGHDTPSDDQYQQVDTSSQDQRIFQHRERMSLDWSTIPEDEMRVVNRLGREGIWAQPGRFTMWRYADVVAWGCIIIETKTSRVNNERGAPYYHWRLQTRKPRNVIRADLIMLVCLPDDAPPRFALFPNNHPVFYKGGQLKTGLQYKPSGTIGNRPKISGGVTMTSTIWKDYEDAYELIEQQRILHESEIIKFYNRANM